jgi:hypothetical protein
MSSGKPLEQASAAAMRDAAAKFLVQFPEQSVGARLARNEAIVVESKSATADAGGIETVPIEEATVDAGPAITPTPPAETPSTPPAPLSTPPVVPTAS